MQVNSAAYAARAADLVNADLTTTDELRAQLAERPSLASAAAESDLAPLQAAQRQLVQVVDAAAAGDDSGAVAALNELLAQHPVRPRVSGHDRSDWHLHVSDDGAPVSQSLISEALFGLALLATDLDIRRLGRCASTSCHRVFVDTSDNSSRRFCSTRCSTRENVAALRRRRAQT